MTHHGFKEFASKGRKGAETGEKQMAEEIDTTKPVGQEGDRKNTTQPDYFSVKTLHSADSDRKKSDKEVGILKAMKKKPHPHIITLLVTYEYDEKFHLLFPLADCDLLQYWKTGNKSQAHNDEGTARWLAQQCHGLTSALRQVQQSSRSSSDGFEERAKLVRRSLFCSELDIHQNMSDPDPRTLVCQHGDLKPQNILLKDRCRLAQRMTFGPLDNPQFADDMRERSECTRFFHDFLDLIQHRMLVIDPKQSSSQLEEQLRELKDRGDLDAGYFVRQRWK
ncbi:uncharacterized protein PODANS_6_1975 [Podospora anserina S mat+]|uniref:Podospora anserina S mat+ genomic DNA chromosome 6, supercontig 2 n=1 Tax=Podospora anserina (strain S / ATCC MYA-4624 / DSM 980 / FGSC 10383) TaxID=515849 RepID=B2B2V5_PODAN|nr:uncharacterized protein PODANS_6_1975 [Podospora anserina S mat+]CAP71441.1 unnamed protein product [Podospora anserina S mat+]CDP30839.1 Putative protein of unknown function [Podospora anserina S mat+]